MVGEPLAGGEWHVLRGGCPGSCDPGAARGERAGGPPTQQLVLGGAFSGRQRQHGGREGEWIFKLGHVSCGGGSGFSAWNNKVTSSHCQIQQAKICPVSIMTHQRTVTGHLALLIRECQITKKKFELHGAPMCMLLQVMFSPEDFQAVMKLLDALKDGKEESEQGEAEKEGVKVEPSAPGPSEKGEEDEEGGREVSDAPKGSGDSPGSGGVSGEVRVRASVGEVNLLLHSSARGKVASIAVQGNVWML